MSFLAPFMLWGTLAASIPIALHFFFRSRYRTVPWAAMKFLLTSVEQTSRRLKFQELLLLAVRCLVLILLALAFARPLSTVVRGEGRGDAVDAVFVFDTSYSMGAGDGSMSRLDRARQEALKVIDQLPAHSTVQVITCADRAALLGPRSPANIDQARHLVQNLPLTSLATDLYPGVAEATGVLQRGQASNKELYIFSDMQKLGWEQQTGDLTRALQNINEKTTVFLVRCGTRKLANVAVTGIAPQSGVPRPGERVGFAVVVKNTGSEPVEKLKVSLAVDGNDKNAESQEIPKIMPGDTRAVTLTGKLEKPGLRLLTARINHDDMEGDNRFDQVILVREKVGVLVVDGGVHEREPEKSSSYYLMHALLPITDAGLAKHYLQPRLVAPRLAAPALLAKQELCILVNVALQADPKNPKGAQVLPADFVEELAKFVRQGHGLIIYAGDNVDPEAYNRILGKKHGLLPLPLKAVAEQQKPWLLNRNSAALPAYWKFKDDDYFQDFNSIEVFKFMEVEEPVRKEPQKAAVEPHGDSPPSKDGKPDPLTIAFRYNNGKPAVVSRKIDSGEAIFITTAADLGWKATSPDPTWTNWPLNKTHIPFVDVTVSYLLHGQTQSYNVVAGEKLDWYPTEKQEHAYTLIYPDGKNVRLGQPELNKSKRKVVTASELPTAGIYRMVATRPAGVHSEDATILEPELDKSSGSPVAVVPDLRESQDLGTLTSEQLDERLGFRPIHLTAGMDTPNQGLGDRLNREWTMWLLLAVLVLAVCESLLAFWCGRAW